MTNPTQRRLHSRRESCGCSFTTPSKSPENPKPKPIQTPRHHHHHQHQLTKHDNNKLISSIQPLISSRITIPLRRRRRRCHGGASIGVSVGFSCQMNHVVSSKLESLMMEMVKKYKNKHVDLNSEKCEVKLMKMMNKCLQNLSEEEELVSLFCEDGSGLVQ
ncbi:hypothetical protein ACFE04_020058 [Oxalis oulophora]